MIRTTAILVMSLALSALAKDDWVTKGTDPEFPTALYFVGVGMSERGSDAAKSSAVVEVKKQLSVSIKATVFDEQMSLSVGGKEVASRSRAESRARLTTQGEVSGIEVVKTAQQGKAFYALAVLDKKNFEANARTRIKELKSELDRYMKGAEGDIASAQVGAALKKLADAKKAMREILDQRTLLSAAAEITDAEKLNYTAGDVSALYEKCVSSVRMTAVSGDGQQVAAGLIPSEPFVVELKVADMPVPMVPLVLKSSRKKAVMTVYTGDNGRAEFYLGEEAETETGSHTFTVEIALPVSQSLQSVLDAQKKVFSYKVVSSPCYADIIVTAGQELAAEQAGIADKVRKRFAQYDIQQDSNACMELRVSVSAKETGYVQGVSEARSFMKTDVTAQIALVDDKGTQVASLTKTARGTGSTLAKSAMQGIDILELKTDLPSLTGPLCGAVSVAVTKKKIAVFSFKNLSWYASWLEVSEALSDMVITRLINAQAFDVVERSRIETIMEEKKLALSGVVEQADAAQIAGLVGADLILLGSASIHGGLIDIDARIVDAKSGVAQAAANVAGFSLSNLRGLADAIADKLAAVGKKQARRSTCK